MENKPWYKKWWGILIIIFSIILLVFALLFAYNIYNSLPRSQEEIQQINDEIDNANYCNVKEDCVNIGLFCDPYICDVIVNVNEEAKIRKLRDSFSPSCDLLCNYAYPIEIACIDGKCQLQQAN